MSVAEDRNTSPRVLIAENSATQSQRLTHILESGGFRVSSAANGKLALEMARRQKPSLVVSDVVMPEMSGYELCSAIKNDSQLGDVPVMLVTPLTDLQDVFRGLQCRADNFILKPYDAEQLLEHVNFALVNDRKRQSEQHGLGLAIEFGSQKHFITADRLQILNLLLSTYQAAISAIASNELQENHSRTWRIA